MFNTYWWAIWKMRNKLKFSPHGLNVATKR